jgi:hypothetical protein
MSTTDPHLDDLFDTRQEIRRLRKAVADTRAAAAEARSELAAATARSEEILVQMEHQQGRLEFPEDDAAPTPKKRGRPRKQASGAAAAKHAE